MDIMVQTRGVYLKKIMESSYANRTDRDNNQSILTIRQAVRPAFGNAQGINKKPSKTLKGLS